MKTKWVFNKSTAVCRISRLRNWTGMLNHVNSGNNDREQNWLLLSPRPGRERPVRIDCNLWMSKMPICCLAEEKNNYLALGLGIGSDIHIDCGLEPVEGLWRGGQVEIVNRRIGNHSLYCNVNAQKRHLFICTLCLWFGFDGQPGRSTYKNACTCMYVYMMHDKIHVNACIALHRIRRMQDMQDCMPRQGRMPCTSRFCGHSHGRIRRILLI
jgi:hypothetical protein